MNELGEITSITNSSVRIYTKTYDTLYLSVVNKFLFLFDG